MQKSEQFDRWKTCVLIPTYNNAATLGEVIDSVLRYTNSIIVVNDGSTDQTAEILKQYETRITVHHLLQNGGKGLALRKGFEIAIEKGYQRAITLDSDGQHRSSDLPKFLDALEQHPNALLVGARNMTQENVPGTSSFGHKFSNFWYQVMTGRSLPDTQSGYRLYPLEAMKKMRFYTTKYELEMETLVRLSWQDIEVLPVPIDVHYPPEGERVTHFRKVPDFTRISILNTVLVAIALFYMRPRIFFRNLQKKSPREFVQEYILNSQESNLKITLALMLGLFIGVSPFWGYQILIIIALCVVFRLNKVIALVAGHISIPPMIPLILFASYKLGGFVIGNEQQVLFSSTLTFADIRDNVVQYVVGSFCLATLLALVGGLLTYPVLMWFRTGKTELETVER